MIYIFYILNISKINLLFLGNTNDNLCFDFVLIVDNFLRTILHDPSGLNKKVVYKKICF